MGVYVIFGTVKGSEGAPAAFALLKSLAEAVQHLKPGITFEILDELAMRINDNESAIQLRTERNKLFNLIFEQDRKQA